jgi:uncharacterized membrane protein YccC
MRTLLFVLLVVALGATWWELHSIRREVASLRAELKAPPAAAPRSAAPLSADPGQRAVAHLGEALDRLAAGDFAGSLAALDQAEKAAQKMGSHNYQGNKQDALERIRQAQKAVKAHAADARQKLRAASDDLRAKVRRD